MLKRKVSGKDAHGEEGGEWVLSTKGLIKKGVRLANNNKSII